MTDLREDLAAVQHAIWSGWMRHLFAICSKVYVGQEIEIDVIRVEDAARWRRQMWRAYDELSEEEKESDRHQVDKVLGVLREHGVDG